MTLLEQIDQWHQRAPQRLAHISGAQTLTYAELFQRSNALALALRHKLTPSAEPVAVLGHKESEMLVAFLGCVKAGRPYIPLDISLPAGRVETILTASGAPLLLTPATVRAWSDEFLDQTADFQPAPLTPDAPWYIIFTSGSTGAPKGVVITRQNLESFVGWSQAEQNFLPAGEVFLNQAPFSFDLSVMDLYSSLASGGTLFSLTRELIAEPKKIFAALTESRVSVWVSTPSFAQLCLAEPTFRQEMLPSARKFWFCGETLTPEVAASLLKRFPAAEVWNTYGPTEATVATTSLRVDADILAAYAPLPVGRPKPNSRILILTNGLQAEAGQRGEIVIAGQNVSAGYLHQPELSARSFYQIDSARAYRTGDMGHFQDGFLFFDGRMDFQIKLHGYRIEIGDIEANLQALTGVRDAVVLPILKSNKVEYLAAFVILQQAQSGSTFEISRALKRELGARLPDYMIPRKFVFLPDFPMTPNGKADRRKLAERLA
ncbi:MAG: D-alanine--poly(phosphoribitol) ligase subunit DltA [Anaerolineae bacterium CG_4_9_14_3_um_filter_57_17]|nr:amino acid adenylation domain-containing protein [bacterium]NCT21498.1 amino acid adenylation domain-containing protein [bacterium]OIO86638.1 MAG: hypothetical protein AUK01_02560 [Anaerolineae bacterium CG2_30_57_67]PJB64906.1 MAG: D-alanine--poly(phosphoribitol) ligase subunit DltA [Anaerolineae bacterium CG_4_9_14_3_um_filter_57_17]